MIRHQKAERTRLSGFNAESWKTDKTIDEIYSTLAEEETDFAFPYELEEHESGREAIFRSVSGNYQVNAHEYDEVWKDTEIDFIYFGNVNGEVNNTIDSYKDRLSRFHNQD